MRKTRLFGTDGIRGRFGVFPLDRVTVEAFGEQLARLLVEERAGRADDPGAVPLVVLGGDTRFSTPALCDWLATGLARGGAGQRFCGVVPTPAIAWATRELGARCGVAVSASHNPAPDNGLKLISDEGFKWPLEREAVLERRLLAAVADYESSGASESDLEGTYEGTGDGEGTGGARASAGLRAEPELAARYLEALVSTLPAGEPLAGLRVVLDTGNGAASALAGPLFERLGAEVAVLHDAPDGRNINRGCGSTHPQELAAAVAARGFDLGVAFDGDADRAIFADERGTVRDGDATLYLWARHLAAHGGLRRNRIVATSMSNLGLERALAREGIAVTRCEVGDRAVVETMRSEGIVLGGEQSGHIVPLELATTGDGLLTAIQIAAIVAAGDATVSELLAGFRRFPQVLLNVEVASKPSFDSLPAVREAAARVENQLGEEGRLVLRYSGTEPLARVMIEGPEQEQIESYARTLAGVIERELR